jgi:hypothetical protein
MAAQGEETVYPAPSQLGKICLFNGDLRGGAGAEKRGWTGARASVMIAPGKWETL